MIVSNTGLGSAGSNTIKISFIGPACQQLQKWKSARTKVKTLCQDDARENKLFDTRAAIEDWKWSTKFEHTARETPQHNSPVEIGFTTQVQGQQECCFTMQILTQ